jgi:subtilisin family serine protease
MDDNRHGTHVAGTIGAVGNNGIGVAGVKWDHIKIMAVKFLDAAGSGYTSAAIAALNYAVAEGATI